MFVNIFLKLTLKKYSLVNIFVVGIFLLFINNKLIIHSIPR